MRLVLLASILMILLASAIVNYQVRSKRGDVSDITSIKFLAFSENWDADAEDDGFTIMIYFVDDKNPKKMIKVKEFTAIIRIFEFQSDLDFHTDENSLIFEVNHLIENNNHYSPEIRISYDDLPSNFPTHCWLEVTLAIPEVGTFKATDEIYIHE